MCMTPGKVASRDLTPAPGLYNTARVTIRRQHMDKTLDLEFEPEADALPPQKRQRTESPSDPRRRSEYWFQDGNVVLQAEDTLYRVHQSILSRHSQFFQDAFSNPLVPSQEDDLIEGCPVVRLSDIAEDMSNTISLLYDSDKTLNIDQGLPIRVLRSMLRLGRKYVITHLENKALRVLHHDYPTTLKAWDSLSSSSRQIKRGHVWQTTSEVISIGHEFGLLTILPAAYARYLEQRRLTFIASDDPLPRKARDRCLVGYARLLEFLKEKSINAIFPPVILPSKDCSSRNKCEANKLQKLKDLPIWATNELNSFGIFRSKHPKATDMCSHCRTEVTKLIDQVRSDFWSSLPSFFELPAWADLKDGV